MICRCGRPFGLFSWRGWTAGRAPSEASRTCVVRDRTSARAEQPALRRTSSRLPSGRGRSPGRRSRPRLCRSIDALATCERTGHRSFEAEPHRVRGEILVKRDPRQPCAGGGSLPVRHRHRPAPRRAQLRPARGAFARQALPIYRPSRRRPRRSFVPALEGFSPTPEMPEIAEAQALLVAIEAGAHVRHE